MKIWLMVVAWASATSAQAQNFPPVTDSDFAIDIYQNTALGSPQIVGMGGTAATSEGSAAAATNPAAFGVRSATSNGFWDWDFHIDVLLPRANADFANTGLTQSTDRVYSTIGIGVLFGNWSLYAGGDVASQSTDQVGLGANAVRGYLGLTYALWHGQVVLGAARASQSLTLDNIAGTNIADVSRTVVRLGTIVKPHLQNYRWGISTNIPYADSTFKDSGAGDIILPARVAMPWNLTVGGSYRFAPTAWNQQVGGFFRDERAITVATDLIFVSGHDDAYGFDAYAQGLLQRSGQKASLSVRVGAESEIFPGRLRARIGTYWEPARLEDTRGRIHFTMGVATNPLRFKLWGPRRILLGGTLDVASRYLNYGFNFGFWH